MGKGLRTWWVEQRAALHGLWRHDTGFRAGCSLLLTALVLAGLGLGCFTASAIGHSVAPQWFGMAPGGADPGAPNADQATFPVLPLHPQPGPPGGKPLAVATSVLGPPATATPTPVSSPTPSSVATAPAATNPPICPALNATPQLSGRSVQDGTIPATLQGGCPAQIIIHAPTHPNATVTLTLTFGTLDPIGCTINLVGTTDANGNATLNLTVPGSHCFHGAILTSGAVTVGGDVSGNTTFAAQA